MFKLVLCFAILVSLIEGNFRLKNQAVGRKIKKNILDSDDAASAYTLFKDAYRDTSTAGLLLATTDMKTYRKEQAKQERQFLENFNKAREHNKRFERGESSFKMSINGFFIMDKEERGKYLGLKGGSAAASRYLSAPLLASTSNSEALPDTFDWRKKGYVTDVKNQGSCGSCWTYGAVGPLEWAYKKATGNLTSLSEQELLDCTYEKSGEDGCNGGWYNDAWDLIISSGSHLASEDSYPYTGKDGACSHGTHPNALKNAVQVTGYVQATKGNEDAVLRALVSKMPLAVAFTVEDDFYIVGEGIYDGCSTPTFPNHAVVMTGYGKNYFEIKNSWGKDWANNGYARLQRGRDICGLLSYSYYVEFKDLAGGGGTDDNNNDDSSDDTDDSSSNNEDDDSNTDDNTDDNQQYTTPPPSSTTATTASATTGSFGSHIDRSYCQDWKAECTNWSRNNYCTKYKDYTTAYCKDSCNRCKCTDNKKVDCNSYKRKGRCFGKKYGDWLALNCPVTCGYCTQCPAGFYTSDEGCVRCSRGSYSSKGALKCTSCPSGKTSPAGSTSRSACKTPGCKAGQYKGSGGGCMVCPKDTYSGAGDNTCTECPAGQVTVESGATSIAECLPAFSCSDNHESCEAWADLGYCLSTDYLGYMTINCEKSCGLCSVCGDEMGDCGAWADMGYCKPSSEYKPFMDINCKKSCGLCGDQEEEKEEEKEECPGGLVMCNGVCKHEHMCKYKV